MALFTGTHENKVDKKGRVSLPADFRAELPDGQDRLIYVFPSPRNGGLEAVDRSFIEHLAERIEQFDMFSEDQEDFSSVILAEARRVAIDGDGRIILPPELLRRAGINGSALFVGAGRRFQIWAPEDYVAHAAAARARASGRTLPRRAEGAAP